MTPRPAPKPKVYFEEWDDPLISGIGWVSELIEIAGGEDILPELRFQHAAKNRIISAEVVRAAAPDVPHWGVCQFLPCNPPAAAAPGGSDARRRAVRGR